MRAAGAPPDKFPHRPAPAAGLGRTALLPARPPPARPAHPPIPAEDLELLRRRSDGKGLTRLTGHLGVIVLTGALVTYSSGTPWMVGALWLHGVALVFLFAPLHETIHYTAFASRWINHGVATAIGFLLLLPARYFRAFHLAHHRTTQDPERDPELAGPKPRTRGEFLRYATGLPLWRERIATTWRHARGRVHEEFIAPERRGRIVLEARVHVALYLGLGAAGLGLGLDALLWYWLVPLLIAQPMLRLFLFAEHAGCPLVPDMLRNSRTTRTNALVRYLTWNMSYHSEHHACAAVPFHALPVLHERLKARIAVQAPGYVRAIRTLAAELH